MKNLTCVVCEKNSLYVICKECKKRINLRQLKCPNCDRKIPNLQFKRKHGCPWCVPIKSTKYCTGEYNV